MPPIRPFRPTLERPGQPFPRDEPPMPGDIEPTLPHTSIEKAALCDTLLPILTAMRETIFTAMRRSPDALPGATALAMGRILLADVRRLLRGERMFHYVATLALGDDRPSRINLGVQLATMETAVTAFRLRYFGYHPALRRPAWYLCGDSAVDDARRLLPRDTVRPGDDEEEHDTERLRELLARRIHAVYGRIREEAAPQPLHAAGGPEVSKEIVFNDWPDGTAG